MTTIEDTLTYIDGSTANGRLVVQWKPFTIGNVNAAGGELEWAIVDGVVSISLYSNSGALPALALGDDLAVAAVFTQRRSGHVPDVGWAAMDTGLSFQL
jgi:hypothetical protein